jgi:hypothetical protein
MRHAAWIPAQNPAGMTTYTGGARKKGHELPARAGGCDEWLATAGQIWYENVLIISSR